MSLQIANTTCKTEILSTCDSICTHSLNHSHTVRRMYASTQVLFLNELEEVLELCRGEQLVQVQDNLFRLLAACLGSSHFQVLCCFGVPLCIICVTVLCSLSALGAYRCCYH